MPDEAEAAERAKYRVKELSLIGHALIPENTEVEFDGLPGSNLIPLNALARAKVKEVEDAEPARVAKLEKQFGDKSGAFGDPKAFADAIVAAVNTANAALAKEVAELRAKLEDAPSVKVVDPIASAEVRRNSALADARNEPPVQDPLL